MDLTGELGSVPYVSAIPLKGPAALTTRAKQARGFNDQKNALKPDRESDSSIVVRDQGTASKRAKGRTG